MVSSTEVTAPLKNLQDKQQTTREQRSTEEFNDQISPKFITELFGQDLEGPPDLPLFGTAIEHMWKCSVPEVQDK